MRIRTIKPEFWQNEELAEMSAESALLAIGLLNYADDEGFFKLHPKLIESTIFPLRELSMTIHGMLSELSRVGFISTHEGSDGRKYGQIVNFLKHQRVNRPNASKIAPILLPVSSHESSVSPHQQVSEPSLPEGKGIGREQGTGKGEGSEPSLPLDSYSTPFSANERQQLTAEVNALHPHWRGEILGREELADFDAALPEVRELGESEWRALKGFFDAERKKPPGKAWPRSRREFLANFSEVLTKASEFAERSLTSNANQAGGRKGKEHRLEDIENDENEPEMTLEP